MTMHWTDDDLFAAYIAGANDANDGVKCKRETFEQWKVRERTHSQHTHSAAKYPASCKRCKDTGVIETGNNDWPCDCAFGDRALFNTERGTETGAEIKAEIKGRRVAALEVRVAHLEGLPVEKRLRELDARVGHLENHPGCTCTRCTG